MGEEADFCVDDAGEISRKNEAVSSSKSGCPSNRAATWNLSTINKYSCRNIVWEKKNKKQYVLKRDPFYYQTETSKNYTLKSNSFLRAKIKIKKAATENQFNHEIHLLVSLIFVLVPLSIRIHYSLRVRITCILAYHFGNVSVGIERYIYSVQKKKRYIHINHM